VSTIETRLRDALQAHAEATDVVVPLRFVPNAPVRRRRPLRLAAAGVALALAAGAVGLVVRRPESPRPSELHVTDTAELQVGPPASPLPRVIVDLPGLRLDRVEERFPTALQEPTSGPGFDGFHIQSFRTAEGLAGPLLWALTVPAPPSDRNDYGFGLGRPVAVQGTTAWLSGGGPGYRLAWAGSGGGGVILTSLHLSEDELLAVARGLRPRATGWEFSVLPHGLAGVVDSPRRGGPGARTMDADYNGQGVAASVSVSTAGPASFEDQIMGVGIAPSVQPVTVAGVVGLLIEEPGRPNSRAVVWQPSPTTVARVRLISFAGGIGEMLAGVRVVTEDEWLGTLPERTVRPASVPAEVTALQQGVPLPAGRGWGELRIAAVARDRQSLADQVVSWAVCAWNDEWQAATDAGDGGRAGAAIDAVAASGAWPSASTAYAGPAHAASRAEDLAEQLRAGMPLRSCR
jgi:hypothetical protein